MVKRKLILHPLAAAAAAAWTVGGCAIALSVSNVPHGRATYSTPLHYQSGGAGVLEFASPDSSQATLVPPPPGLKKPRQVKKHPQIEVFVENLPRRPKGSKQVVGAPPLNAPTMEDIENISKARITKKKPLLKKPRRRQNIAPVSYQMEVPMKISEKQPKTRKSVQASSRGNHENDMAQLIGSIREFRRVMNAREEYAALNEFAPTSDAEWAASLDPPMTVFELRDIIQAGRNARETLIANNEGLVVQVAKRYQSKNLLGSALTFQDMIQEGKMGVLEAAERFDPSKGYQFSTYATYWIRQRILRCLADHSRTIRLPAHVHSLVSQMHKHRQEMTYEIGRPPSFPELAHRMGISVEKLKLYSERSQNVISLENPLNKNGGSYRGSGASLDDHRKLGDYIASDGPSPQDCAEQDSLRNDIRGVLEKGLSPRERQVLTLRYGLEDGNPRNLEETARELQVTKDRIRLIESKALNKLRCPGRNYRLKQYVDTESINDDSFRNEQGSLSQLEKQFKSTNKRANPARKEFDPFALDSRWSFL